MKHCLYFQVIKKKSYPALIIPFILLAACATTKAKPGIPAMSAEPVQIVESAELIELRFKKAIRITTPNREPANIEEHIRCGLFLFDQEKFEDAAGEFEKAHQSLAEHQNPLYRACLMSLAVCRLLTDDKAAFLKNMDTLRLTYNRYEWMDIRGRNGQVKALFDLYNKLLKNGNF